MWLLFRIAADVHGNYIKLIVFYAWEDLILDVFRPVRTTSGPTRQSKTTVMKAIMRRLCGTLSPFSVSTYDISTPPPSSLHIFPILLKHIHCVIANLWISLAPVKRLFIILQFGRVQIFSLGHSLEQTAYYCWRALDTVLSGPAEASEPFYNCWVRWEDQAFSGDAWGGQRFDSLQWRGPQTQINTLTHPFFGPCSTVKLKLRNIRFEDTLW